MKRACGRDWGWGWVPQAALLRCSWHGQWKQTDAGPVGETGWGWGRQHSRGSSGTASL